MTADTNLSARRCERCGQTLACIVSGVAFGGNEHIVCPPIGGWPARERMIPLADAESMVEAEREACAKIVMSGQSPFIQDIAAAIRARGVTE